MTMPSDEPIDPVFEALWARILEAWDDDKAHGALLEHALREQRLPELAGRYRALENDPDKGERAKKKLALIVVAATNLLQVMKGPDTGNITRGVTIVATIVSALLIGYVAWRMYLIYSRR
jgi:hypothetical protein